MKSLTERIASRWMQAGDGEEPSESVGEVSPGVFVDLMVFFQAVAAYRLLKGDQDPITQRAAALVRRFQSDLVAGANRYFEPLTDDAAFARLKPAVRILTRGTRGLDHAVEQAAAIQSVLGALHSKPQVVREVFSESRSYTAAMRLAALSSTDSAGSLLNSLAALTPASRLQLTRKWVREASEGANVAPSKVETVLADAENARHLGEDLHTVEVQLAAADPVSQRAADLQVEKRAIIDQIEAVVNTSADPSVVLSSAAEAATQPQDYATQTAKRSKLSPDQERAMMVRGKAIIAAGAGSGKTATLASKVAYHVNELGVPPGAVIATSFSRKSAAELRKRIGKYGADIPDAVSTGFGTTHSVAGKLLREYGGGGRDGMKNYQQTDLVRLAMEQVQMVGPGVPTPAPESLFDVSKEAPVGIKFRDAVQMAFDRRQKLDPWSKGFIESFFNPSDQWYARTMRATKNLTDPKGLSDKQVEIIKKVFNRLGIAYSPTTDPSLQAQPQNQAKMAAKDKNKGLREKYKFFSQPANEWFNLGLELVEEDGQGNKKPIPTGFFKNAISKFKGRAVSPSEAWAISNGAPEAAVYAAYEWLKGSKGETDFQGLGDHDDVLLDVSKMLLSSPRVMQQVQSRFKVVLVDEAQDLNRCVHGDTEVQTPNGPVLVRDICVGDQVLSFENGQVVYNRVLDKARSSWERGYRVRTMSGRTLAMSPNHRIYASALDGCPEGQMALYLMYREGMGFRMGTSKRLFESRDTSSGRAAQEHADCAWILEMGEPEDILYKEQSLSLRHAIPTYIFEGTSRGCDQTRIDRIFKEFGENGRKLLAEYDLDFQYPHWVGQNATRGKISRRVVNFCAHRGKGQQDIQRGSFVSMNWTGENFDVDVPIYDVKGGRKMIGKMTADYAEGRSIAQHVAERAGAYLTETLSLDDEKLPLITASGLLPGMRIPVCRDGVDIRDMLPIGDYKEIATQMEVSLNGVGGSRNTGKREIHNFLRDIQLQRGCAKVLPSLNGADMVLEEIESVEVVSEGDYWDIAVENAHNFFGNGILSHNSQHLMFGLITGFVDPAKVPNIAKAKKMGELAKDDGSMTADTYAFIGDDKQAIYEFRAADPEAFIDMSELVEGGAGFKTEVLKTNYRSGQLIVDAANRLIAHNCVDVETPIETPQGSKRAGDIVPGDVVTTYHEGELAAQPVTEVTVSAWTHGLKITTTSGHTLTMSPTHRIWASEPIIGENETVVYLMYRRTHGFRIGVTKHGGRLHRDEGIGFGKRAAMEYGERMWVLGVFPDKVTALTEETALSLRYQIPMTTFNAGERGPSQTDINNLFSEFGRNGGRLLEERNLSFEYPHWSAQSQNRNGRVRDVVSIIAHAPSGTDVYWKRAPDGFVPRKRFHNYQKAREYAESLAQEAGGLLVEDKLSLDDADLRLMTASALLPGMMIPIRASDTVRLSAILSIDAVKGQFIDLAVAEDNVFFGGGILSHNSRQIPMTCTANPQRVDRGGIEAVNFPPVEGRDMGGPAAWLANSIAETMEEGRAGAKGYDAFGVGLRSNAEAYTYGIELLKKGIPFRSKANFFGDPTTKALLYWLTIADEGLSGNADRINAAVLGARKAPASKLGDKLEEILTQKATGNYLLWLKDNWTAVYGARGEWAILVRAYVDNLLKVAALKGGSSEQVLETILDLTGHDGRSVRQVLVDRVADDEEAISELRAESPTGTVSDTDIEAMAFAPIAPLKGLLGARADLTEAMKYVRQLQSANEKLTANDDPDDKKAAEPAVTLGTMHSWKGLEVENMYIPFVGGRFPRSDADEDDLASERRLAYVAVTRGENQVVVMNIPTVRRTKMGPITQTSPFVGEMCVPPAMGSPYSLGDEEDAEQEAMGLEEQMNRTASHLSDDAISAYLSRQKGQ